jgi:signal transduction protein with GAF and PtsI domain
MAAPLVVQGQRVGVLAAASTQPRAFSARDLATLELLAGLIAVVIERAPEVSPEVDSLSKSDYGALSGRSSWRASGHPRARLTTAAACA